MVQRTCSMPECEKPHYGHGLCNWHYRQEQRGMLGEAPKRPNRKSKYERCCVEECPNPPLARAMCSMHYKRWRKTGSTDERPQFDPPVERFWTAVDRDGAVPDYRPDLGPCWIWTGARNKRGYALLWVDGGQVLVPRWCYEQFVGPIPDGYQIDHLCRVTSCVNFERHLEPVTPEENMRRIPFEVRSDGRKRGWLKQKGLLP